MNPFRIEFNISEMFAERNGEYPSRREVNDAIAVTDFSGTAEGAITSAVCIIEKRRERRSNRPIMWGIYGPLQFNYVEVPNLLKLKLVKQREIRMFDEMLEDLFEQGS